MLVSKNKLSFSKYFARLAMILYSAVLLLISVLRINASGALNTTTVIGFRADYLLHILLFVPFMPLARCGWSRVQRRTAWFWPACGAGLAMAAFLECLQWFLPYRTFNPLDLAANGGGIIVGALIAGLGRGKR
jgi:glycopeptide antibiotics resistance protein